MIIGSSPGEERWIAGLRRANDYARTALWADNKARSNISNGNRGEHSSPLRGT